jgi:hypothetical protein
MLDESIMMYCQASPTVPNKALFTYCAAWDNQGALNCSADPDAVPYPGAAPSTPSKCNCDAFAIDVFVKPAAPTISKTLVGTNTQSEPGGEYTFDISFTNPSSEATLYLSGLYDAVDDNGDGSYETVLDLWGTPVTVVPATEGVYLTDSNCATPAEGSSLVEVGPSATYSCQIKVHIVDRQIVNTADPVVDQGPEDYDDVILAVLQDKNGNPVTNGVTCPTDLSPVAGEHCSAKKTVYVTNLPPSITVTKTPSTDEVLEPGDFVTFNVVVTSTSGTYDDPLTITSFEDTHFQSLGTCTGGSLYLGSPYQCAFQAYIAGNQGAVHSNILTATAIDNEDDEATDSDSATVDINNVLSSITLEKTANPTEVLETGDDLTVFRNVAYTFRFCVNASGVDVVTFSSLTDEPFGPLTSECNVGGTNPATLLNGYVLAPGQCASCTITKGLQGDASDNPPTHFNVATISGFDEDGQSVSDSDDATVTFLDAQLDIWPEFALKATAFVRITNGGVDTAYITGLKIGGVDLVAGNGVLGKFEILNEAAYSFYTVELGESYAFCTAGTAILPGDRYDCAFTLKLYPGFEAGDIDFSGAGTNGLVVTLEDNDGGTPLTTTVDISIQTGEP